MHPLRRPVQRVGRRQFFGGEVGQVLALQDRLGDFAYQAGQVHHPADACAVDRLGRSHRVDGCVDALQQWLLPPQLRERPLRSVMESSPLRCRTACHRLKVGPRLMCDVRFVNSNVSDVRKLPTAKPAHGWPVLAPPVRRTKHSADSAAAGAGLADAAGRDAGRVVARRTGSSAQLTDRQVLQGLPAGRPQRLAIPKMVK